MEKIAFIDIGELGWSLYLSAHLKWLKKNTNYFLTIITSSDRKCLYKDSADLILDVPHDFYKKFKGEQSGFGLYPHVKEDLRKYFQKMLLSDYIIPENFNFDENRSFLFNKVIYKPYEYSKKLEGKKKILIFPRYRKHSPFNCRNLPRLFYINLIGILCNKFPNYEIKTMGLNSSSYKIDEVKRSNYVNGVKESVDLQSLIDECQVAIGAMGSQSGPLKLTLLQGVPTFMIGHQERRHIKKENWLKTKAGFYMVDNYNQFNFKDCIFQIIDFVKNANC